MYGSVQEHEKVLQWSAMENISSEYKYPWLVIGDLNTTLHPSEKEGGTNNPNRRRALAVQCICNLGLTDVVWSGDPYTWSNHRHGDSLIRVRLDHALSNSTWHENFPLAQLNNLFPVGSDHSPVLLITESTSIRKKNKPFRLFEYWLGHKDCKSIIAAAWNSDVQGNNNLNTKLLIIQHALTNWSQVTFGSIQNRIKQIRNNLMNLSRNNPVSELTPQYKQLKIDLAHWYDVHNQHLRQISRDNYFSYGDRNIKYFHARANFSISSELFRN